MRLKKASQRLYFLFISNKIIFIKLVMEYISINSFVIKCRNDLTKSYQVNLYTILFEKLAKKRARSGALQVALLDLVKFNIIAKKFHTKIHEVVLVLKHSS